MKKGMGKKVCAGVLAGVMSMGALCMTAYAADDVKIAVLPKMKGENYWDACKEGAEDAIAELSEGNAVTLLYDGPPQDLISRMITTKVLLPSGMRSIVV